MGGWGLNQDEEVITLTAGNPYTNYTFDIEILFTKTHDDVEERVLWIVIVAVGGFMLLGLVVAYARQNKRLARMKQEEEDEKRQTLLTGQETIVSSADEINRTSADPSSVRASH